MISDFDRDVYCLAGLPFDAIDMNKAVSLVRNAKFTNSSYFLSTPNINFVATAVKDNEFLKSVIYSDLVVADGTPIVWMAKMLNVPVKQRVAGSSLFETLSQDKRRQMKVYFMGGLDGVAEAASNEVNRSSPGMSCVGFYSPGFGSVDDMSTDEIINNINSSNADFLVIALGAKKGQAWILKNLKRITIPLVSHLGAVINFEAKRFKRAPAIMQNTGFEWLWRIKEEPALWRRYFNDGLFFSKILIDKVLPLMLWLRFNKKRLSSLEKQSNVTLSSNETHHVIKVKGAVLGTIKPEHRTLFKEVSQGNKHVHFDLSEAEYLSFGFLGLVLMLKKNLDPAGLDIRFIHCNTKMKKIIKWNGLNYLKA